MTEPAKEHGDMSTDPTSFSMSFGRDSRGLRVQKPKAVMALSGTDLVVQGGAHPCDGGEYDPAAPERPG